MKKIIKLTESDLELIIKKVINEDSFYDKVKQSLSIFKPFKLTPERKSKLFEFWLKEVDNGDYIINMWNDGTLEINTRKKIVIDGIKGGVNLYVTNIGELFNEGKNAPFNENLYIDLREYTKGSARIDFLSKDSPTYRKLVGLILMAITSDYRTLQLVYQFAKQKKKPSKPISNPTVRNNDEDDDDDDDNFSIPIPSFDTDSSDDDNDHGIFGGFDGGETGGGGAGGEW